MEEKQDLKQQTGAGQRSNAKNYEKYLVGRSYKLFRSGIRAEKTVVFYNRCLYFFCSHLDMSTEQIVGKYGPYLIENGKRTHNLDAQVELQRLVEDYVLDLQDKAMKGELKPSSCITRMPPVKLFFEMNDLVLNWTKLSKLLPRGDAVAVDEAYTRELVRSMLPHCDLRARTLVLLLFSSGIRLGAVPGLKDGDINPMYDATGSALLCAHLKVYAGTDAEYDTFMTPEAYLSYFEYRKLRKKYGEKITPQSPAFVMRFDETSFSKHKPKALNYHTAQRLLDKLRKKAGIAVASENYNNRYTIKVAHGFRKGFLSSLKSVKTADGRMAIDFGNRERLMGHALVDALALEDNYDRQDMVSVLKAEYCKAVPVLTISDEARLASQVTNLRKDIQSYENLEAKMRESEAAKVKELQEQLKRQKEESDRRYEHVLWLIQQNPLLARIKPEELEKLMPTRDQQEKDSL